MPSFWEEHPEFEKYKRDFKDNTMNNEDRIVSELKAIKVWLWLIFWAICAIGGFFIGFNV